MLGKPLFVSLSLLLSSFTTATNQAAFTNAEGFISCNESEIIRPTSTEQVQEIIKSAYEKGISVKASGAGHSTNHIICSQNGGIILKMEDMNSIISVDKDKLQVTVQGGAGLTKFFRDMVPYEITIEGLVDYGAITVAGAIATGAHASSLKVNSGVADHMVGCRIVNGKGDLITLTNENRDFRAIHTNLGALGILVEVTFQAVPLFKVRGKQVSIKHLDSLPDQVIPLVKQFDWANLYWFSDNNAAILHTYNKIDPSTPGRGIRTTWDPSFSSAIPWGYYKAIELLNNVFSENEMCLLAQTRALTLANSETTEEVGYLGDMYMGNVCEGDHCLFPQVDDVEIAIPLQDLPNALKDIKKITDATKVCFPVFGIYVRFGLQSQNTLLGPTRNGDVAYVELHVLRTRNNSPHLGFAAIDEIRQLLLVKYKGQPHYGKNFAVDFIGGAKKNNKNNTFEESFFSSMTRKYDPRGIFQNQFLQSRYKDPSLFETPGCAHNRSCICSKDDHCYNGWVCTTGSVYTDAQVCKKGKGVKCERGDECASGSCSFLSCT